MQPRQIVSGYFALQAVSVVAWWVLLVVYPESIVWFQPKDWPDGVLLSFWLADLSLIVVGSGVAAVGVWQKRGKQGDVPAAFRVTSMNPSSSLLSTLGQIVIFWGTFLWILPMGIVEAQGYLGWERFEHPLQTLAFATLFLPASCLGLWSGISMVTRGGGTPLPTAAAPRLVVTGPYQFVRNPMAVAGIVQGVAVGWLLGSLPVIVYSLTGIVAWHVFVRPVEERELLERFGESYDRYRSRVRVWVPKPRRMGFLGFRLYWYGIY